MRWNGAARTTTFVSATQLRAAITAADIAAAGTAQVSVVNPGGAASGALPFTVRGNPDFALTVTKNGTGKGTITSSPAGINCGGTCSATFFSGGTVTLTVKINGKGLCGLEWRLYRHRNMHGDDGRQQGGHGDDQPVMLLPCGTVHRA